MRGLYSFNTYTYQDNDGNWHGNWRRAWGWVDNATHVAKKSLYAPLKVNPLTGEVEPRYRKTYYYRATNIGAHGGGNISENYIWKKGKLESQWHGRSTATPHDDWWGVTGELVKSAVTSSTGFMYGFYSGTIKGDWQKNYWGDREAY